MKKYICSLNTRGLSHPENDVAERNILKAWNIPKLRKELIIEIMIFTVR